MACQVWFRNPSLYIKELIEAGAKKVVWDEGYCGKRSVDPHKLCELYFGQAGLPYELLFVSPSNISVQHFVGRDLIGVYPLWSATYDSIEKLENLSSSLVADDSIPGQKHIIVIHEIPSVGTHIGKRALRLFSDMQKEFDVEYFIHGLYSFSSCIRLGFRNFDFEPRTDAAQGKVYLPSGKCVVVKKEIHRYGMWTDLLGFKPVDLEIPRNRCIFNILSVTWIANKGSMSDPFAIKRSKNDPDPDPSIPDSEVKLPVRKTAYSRLAVVKPGDKVECNTCSLQTSCRVFQVDSICTLPGAEMGELAGMFNTRDTETILTGLSRLASISAARVERAVEFEEDFGIDPEVTKIIGQTFKLASEYAKLNDPRLRMQVNINQNRNGNGLPFTVGSSQAAELPSAQEALAKAVEYYKALGVPQENITQEMLLDYVKAAFKGEEPQPAITGEVHDAEVVS